MPLRPLEGFVVGVTADRRWEEQAELLTRRGAMVVHCPTITTLYLASDDDLRRATLALVETPPDYLVVTTGIGIRAWLETAMAWGVGDALVDALSGTRIVARGPKAAAAVQAGGLDVWERSATEQMDNVLALLLAEPLAGKRVAIQEYGMKSPELTGALAGAGADVIEVPVYRWRRPDDDGPALRLIEAATSGRMDAVTFTSAPAVHNLFEIAAENQLADRLRAALNGGVVAACVGPVCAGGAREEGVGAPLVPPVGRLGLLVRALSDDCQSRRRTFTLGGTELVVQGSAVVAGGAQEELTPKERAVFELLAAAPGTVVSRQRLLSSVWGSAGTDPHALEVTVGRLRRRLGPCGSAVEAVSGRGYRINPGPAASSAAVLSRQPPPPRKFTAQGGNREQSGSMTATPRAEQLDIPREYGTPSRLLAWDVVAARLADARHYWLATVRPDGRPHAVPLDGLWLDDRWYFGGSPTTVKHRNLLLSPHVSMHLEDGGSAVIVEGACAITMPAQETAERLSEASQAKYGYGPPPATYLGGVWVLSPTKVLAWTDLTADATRFLL